MSIIIARGLSLSEHGWGWESESTCWSLSCADQCRSRSGISLKCPQFLTNASCLSVLFLSHVAITSPQPQKMSIALATSYGWHLVFSNVSSNWLLEKRHSRIGYICLTFLHCVYLNVLSNCLPETWEEVYLHWLHLFDFSPLCIFKCFFKSLARK